MDTNPPPTPTQSAPPPAPVPPPAAAPDPSAPPAMSRLMATIANAHAASTQQSSEQRRREEEMQRKRREERRREREEWVKRRDGGVGELMVLLDDYRPLIPDEVTDHYLQKSGFDCQDARLKRLLSLAAQKFVSDITQDAFHYAKLRTSAATGTGGSSAEGEAGRLTMTMDDLGRALGDHGVDGRKPDYCT
ncbi:hypothetical protein NCC49_005992 [Naganishia albida]|nr:hypothetical protein NCC49_005992 [Naganishia albida]